MKHKKFQVIEHSPWTLNPPVAAEFYSRRAAEEFAKKASGDTKYEVVPVEVPAYKAHCGSPGVGDPELRRRAEGTPSTTPAPVVAEPVARQADEEGDGEVFTFLNTPWVARALTPGIFTLEYPSRDKGYIYITTKGLDDDKS